MGESESMNSYTKILVARYLKKNGFEDSLQAFLKESGQSYNILNIDTQNDGKTSIFEDLETIISERTEYVQQSLSQEIKELTINDRLPPIDEANYVVPHWNQNLCFDMVPLAANTNELPTGLPVCINFCDYDDSLIVSTSSKEVLVYKNGALNRDFSTLSKKKGIIRLCGTIGDSNFYYFGCLDGSLIITNDCCEFALKLHRRIISHISFVPINNDEWLIISCGLDNFLKLHKLYLKTGSSEELSQIKLLSPCTSMLVAYTPDSAETLIFISRQDFTHIMCYTSKSNNLRLAYKLALNNSQFNAFSFNVRDMIILGDHKQNGIPTLSSRSTIAVATSHMPFMRLLLVEIPFWNSNEDTETSEKTFYDKVLRNMATEISQDPYSQPIIKTIHKNDGVVIGDNNGMYAIDISRGDTWILTLPEMPSKERIKSMQTNKAKDKLAICLANRSIYMYSIGIKSL